MIIDILIRKFPQREFQQNQDIYKELALGKIGFKMFAKCMNECWHTAHV